MAALSRQLLSTAAGAGGRPAARAAADHWYHAATGVPCHAVPLATNPTQRRAPEIRDARRLALVPSVTTVLGIVNRPGIQYWRMQQFLHAVREFQARPNTTSSGLDPPDAAADTDPFASAEALESSGRGGGVDDDDDDSGGDELDDGQWRAVQQLYSRRISQAADLGSQVHTLLDRHIRWRYQLAGGGGGGDARAAPAWPAEVAPMRDAVDHWLDEDVAAVELVERSFACRYGYGGKVDLVCRLRDGSVAVCDFKTQAAHKRFTMHSYWPCQLAGYAVGLGVPTARLLNVCLDTVRPGTYLVKDWSQPAPGDAAPHPNAAHWEAFRLAFLLWCSPLGRQFDPLRDVPGALPMPTWADVLQHRAAGSVTILAPSDDDSPALAAKA
jgi:hypothetical protein